MTRVTELFPLRMARIWANDDKENRPPVRYYSTLSPEEMDTIYYYRCPAIPYLCSFADDNGKRTAERFPFIIKGHDVVKD